MKYLILFIFLGFGVFSHSQKSISELLKTYNTESVSYISVTELAMPKTDAILLDAREISEFNVSHIKNAIHIGYNTFNIENIKNIITNKTKTIVVYCSVGIRSQRIAEQLKKAGYTTVYNLFGGIFEWKNNDFKVYDSENKETENIHTYSKKWSQWLKKGKKIYTKVED